MNRRKVFYSVENLIIQDRKLLNYALDRAIADPEYKPWGLSKTRIKNLIGCSIHKFKGYIEKKLKSNWTWKNYGTVWNIDHIKPLKFPGRNLSNYKRRFHYKNCQPLSVEHNSSKNNR